jgi:hypothetical protein
MQHSTGHDLLASIPAFAVVALFPAEVILRVGSIRKLKPKTASLRAITTAQSPYFAQ